MITIRFGCGHSETREDTNLALPRCATCGETRVSNVTTSKPPTFTGMCKGPMVKA